MYVTLRVSVSLAHKCVILRPVFSVSALGQAEILHNCSQERAHTLQNVPYHFTIEMHSVSVPPTAPRVVTLSVLPLSWGLLAKNIRQTGGNAT